MVVIAVVCMHVQGERGLQKLKDESIWYSLWGAETGATAMRLACFGV